MNPIVSLGAAGALLLSPLTFVPGCELTPPKIKSHYSGTGRPIARDPRIRVEVFLAGREPGWDYAVVGDVEVMARSRNTSVINMLDYARREARKLGGDAVVDVRIQQAMEASPDACGGSPVKGLTLTGKVVTWEGPLR